MTGYSDFSFTSLWARIGGHAEAAAKMTGNGPRGVVVPLPEAERQAILARIAPHVAGLEDLRLQTLATIDSRARRLVPLVGSGAFVALLAIGQNITSSVIFGFLAAVTGWFIAMGNRSGNYQAAVKARVAAVTSAHLSGFDHVVEPETDLARLHAWHLFPQLVSARTLDRIKGQRDGRALSLSEMSISYAPGRRDRVNETLSFSVVEVASGAVASALVVLTPKDAPRRVLEEQQKAADLLTSSTGDAAFDAVYTMRVGFNDDASVLTAAMRSAILSLREVAPAGLAYLVFMPGYLAVLFPTKFVDLVFHVPPYWVPIDAGALVAQFASDLAIKNRLINAALALPAADGAAQLTQS